jgi:Rieske Fe-S protein
VRTREGSTHYQPAQEGITFTERFSALEKGTSSGQTQVAIVNWTAMEPLSRRRFVKFFSFGTACSALAGKCPFVLEANADETATDGVLKIRISDWPALQSSPGSIQLGVHPIGGWEPLPGGFVYPVTINRGEENQFYAINSECSHNSCIVPTWDPDFGSMKCPCHFSEYAIDGSLIIGAEGNPNQDPLRQYPCSFDGDNTLTIQLPTLGFKTAGRPVSTGAGDRFRLDFPTLPNSQYAFSYRPNIASAWADIEVAVTPDGPLNNSVVAANGLPQTVYAARSGPTGFYSVSVLLVDRA